MHDQVCLRAPVRSPGWTMPPADDEKLVPLLALCQSAALIDHVAATGTVDSEAMRHLLDCLLQKEPPHFPPDIACYAIGRAVLEDILRADLPENQRCIPVYLRAMVKLERKLRAHPALRESLRERLHRAGDFRRHFATEPGAVYAALGGVYTDTLGQLQPAIAVTGAHRQIASRRNADIIRTAILGGVQAAAGWRQAGGRPWQLRFRRRRLLLELERLNSVCASRPAGE